MGYSALGFPSQAWNFLCRARHSRLAMLSSVEDPSQDSHVSSHCMKLPSLRVVPLTTTYQVSLRDSSYRQLRPYSSSSQEPNELVTIVTMVIHFFFLEREAGKRERESLKQTPSPAMA